MLTPEYLSELPEEILKLFAEAETEILADMARRLAKYDFWIPSAEYQNQKLLESGILQEDILKVLSSATRKSEAELRRMMQDAGSMSLKADAAVYEAAGLNVPSIKDSEPLKAILNAGYKATAQTMQNLCRTMANAASLQFDRALDGAWLKVHSGAFDADTAIRDAIKQLSERGVQAIRYRSGRTDSLEVAVRRAVVTGVNQTSAQLQEELADELECDLVEVSAHSGARPEHAVWQGRIFSRSGTHPKYPDFRSETGYGRVDGLCGVNCRHTFGPYIEGSPPVWTEEALAELEKPKYEYDGKLLTEYEASQVQRYNERQIRRWKREYVAMEVAGQDTTEAAVKIRHWQAAQDDFLSKTGFVRHYGREDATHFGYTQASEAAKQAEKFYQEWSKSIGSNNAIETLAKYYDVKYNDSPRYELLKNYVRSVENGRMSPLPHFDLYEEYHARIESEIVGRMVNSIKITGQSKHFLERVFGTMVDPEKYKKDLQTVRRSGVSLESVMEALFNPVEIRDVRTTTRKGVARRSQKFVGKSCVVTVNPDTGILIQTNPLGG